jgi:hypothetical protein
MELGYRREREIIICFKLIFYMRLSDRGRLRPGFSLLCSGLASWIDLRDLGLDVIDICQVT